MRYGLIAGLTILCLVAGIVWYAGSSEWLIIYRPLSIQQAPSQSRAVHKKTLALYFWHGQEWQKETVEILWPDDVCQQLNYLVSKWLLVICQESISEKRVSLQSVLVSDVHDAYLSFDRNPVDKSQATFYNLMWFEGLLKTVREAGIPIRNVYFMTHHQPLHDSHLDFSLGWPLSGFTQR